jgi:hypothetical protein
MARFDKLTFSFRAIAGTALTGVQAVALSAAGQVIAAGTGNVVGVTCIPGTIVSGRPVSVLRDGEIVEFGGTPATTYNATGGGTVGTGAGTKVGFTVEADRLVVCV